MHQVNPAGWHALSPWQVELGSPRNQTCGNTEHIQGDFGELGYLQQVLNHGSIQLLYSTQMIQQLLYSTQMIQSEGKYFLPVDVATFCPKRACRQSRSQVDPFLPSTMFVTLRSCWGIPERNIEKWLPKCCQWQVCHLRNLGQSANLDDDFALWWMTC